jgi:hypothetical protein
MPTAGFVGIWKFIARPNLCVTLACEEASMSVQNRDFRLEKKAPSGCNIANLPANLQKNIPLFCE